MLSPLQGAASPMLRTSAATPFLPPPLPPLPQLTTAAFGRRRRRCRRTGDGALATLARRRYTGDGTSSPAQLIQKRAAPPCLREARGVGTSQPVDALPSATSPPRTHARTTRCNQPVSAPPAVHLPAYRSGSSHCATALEKGALFPDGSHLPFAAHHRAQPPSPRSRHDEAAAVGGSPARRHSRRTERRSMAAEECEHAQTAAALDEGRVARLGAPARREKVRVSTTIAGSRMSPPSSSMTSTLVVDADRTEGGDEGVEVEAGDATVVCTDEELAEGAASASADGRTTARTLPTVPAPREGWRLCGRGSTPQVRSQCQGRADITRSESGDVALPASPASPALHLLRRRRRFLSPSSSPS